jgi:hypothetical protein
LNQQPALGPDKKIGIFSESRINKNAPVFKTKSQQVGMHGETISQLGILF